MARGNNPQGEKWHVSIDKPIISDGEIHHESAEIITITNRAIATSGNYRNYKTDSLGNRYAHIISPDNGRPAKSEHSKRNRHSSRLHDSRRLCHNADGAWI